VLRLPPLLEHGGHQAVATHPHIGCPNDEVVSVLIPEFRFLVGLDTSILVMPLGHQLADGTLGERGQIAVNEPGVLPGEFDLAAEAQVVADKHAGSRDDARREGLVVAVAQAQHPAVVLAAETASEFRENCVISVRPLRVGEMDGEQFPAYEGVGKAKVNVAQQRWTTHSTADSTGKAVSKSSCAR
jgi:hypothetical protein